jgi:hypothetical protein
MQRPDRTPEEYGAGFGEVVQAAGKLGERVYVEQSRTRAAQQSLGLRSKLDGLRTEASQIRGSQAVNLRANMQAKVSNAFNEARAQLADNPLALKAFEDDAAVHLSAFDSDITNHQESELYKSKVADNKANIDSLKDSALRNLGKDSYESDVATVADKDRELALMQGASNEVADRQREASIASQYAVGVTSLLDSKNILGAKAQFDKVAMKLDPAVRADLSGKLQSAIASKIQEDVTDAASAVATKNYAKTGVVDLASGMKLIDEQYPGDARARSAAFELFNKRVNAFEQQQKQMYSSATDSIVSAAREAQKTGLSPYLVLEDSRVKSALVSMPESQREATEQAVLKLANNMGTPPLVKQGLRDLQRNDPTKFNSMTKNDFYRYGVAPSDVDYWVKMQSDEGESDAKDRDGVFDNISSWLKGQVGEDKLDANKLSAARSAFERLYYDPATKNRKDPKEYREVVKSVYLNPGAAANVNAGVDYNPKISDVSSLSESLSDGTHADFDASLNTVYSWAPRAIALSGGKLSPTEPYTTALRILGSMDVDAIEGERLRIRAAMPGAGPVAVEQELVRQLGAKRRTEDKTTLQRIYELPSIVADFLRQTGPQPGGRGPMTSGPVGASPFAALAASAEYLYGSDIGTGLRQMMQDLGKGPLNTEKK